MSSKEDVDSAVATAESYRQDARPDSWMSVFFWMAVAGVRALLLIAYILGEIGIDIRNRY